MQSASELDTEITRLRALQGQVTGRKAEVYSRIVGYYRSVSNWNPGKQEERGKRLMFEVAGEDAGDAKSPA